MNTQPHEKTDNSPHLTPGRKPVLELLNSRPTTLDTVFLAEDAPGLGEIVGACRESGVRFRKVRRAELDRMFPGNHQGVVARLRGRQFIELHRVMDLCVEDKGMRPNVGKRCTEKICIPMPGGFDSLNVAQAGAMIMTEMLRQRA